MDFKVSYNDTQDFFEVRAVGDVDVQGVVDSLGAILTNEKWKPGTDLLADYSESSTIGLNTELVGEISHVVKSQNDTLGKGKLAIIMSSDLDYGYGRMFQLLTEDHIDKEVNIYRDRDSAYNWIVAS